MAPRMVYAGHTLQALKKTKRMSVYTFILAILYTSFLQYKSFLYMNNLLVLQNFTIVQKKAETFFSILKARKSG